MDEELKRNRFLSDFYDSVFQRAYRERTEQDPLYRTRYLGKLRLDAILARRIVLLDTQVLDGGFFLAPENDPFQLMALLSRGQDQLSPIEIRARDDDLATTLLLFVMDRAKSRMRGFSFSGIFDPAERKEATDQLLREDPEKFTDWEAILGSFKDAGVNPSNIELLKQAWSKWIELASKGLIAIRPWKIERGFPIQRYAGSESDFLAGIESPEVLSVAQWAYANLNKRSELDHRIARLKEQASEELGNEFRLIEAKFHRAYDQAAAWQHECGAFESSITNLIEVMQVGFETDRTMIEHSDPQIGLDLTLRFDDIDPLFLHKLGTMDKSAFRGFFWKQSLLLSKWWNHYDIDSLQAAMDGFVKDIVEATVPAEPQSSDAEKLPDIIRVLVETAAEFAPPLKKVYKLLSGLNDVNVKYFSSKRQEVKERLVQRIIDIAKERIRDERSSKAHRDN